MKIKTIRKYKNIPQGSVIQDVKEDGKFYEGLWCSALGSWTVQVPKSYCLEIKWEVDCKGTPESGNFEMSVIRSDNELGHSSWGWFDENKLLITSQTSGVFPMRRMIWNRLKQQAYDIADELNKKEK